MQVASRAVFITKGKQMYYGNMMGMHALWWVFWAGLIAYFLFWNGSANSARRNKPRETPHEALRRRLASGEVNAEDYERRKVLLDRDS
jgi:putative membrane protein